MFSLDLPTISMAIGFHTHTRIISLLLLLKIVFFCPPPSLLCFFVLIHFMNFTWWNFACGSRFSSPVKVFPNTKPINIKLTTTQCTMYISKYVSFHVWKKNPQSVSFFISFFFISFLVSISHLFVLFFLPSFYNQNSTIKSPAHKKPFAHHL